MHRRLAALGSESGEQGRVGAELLRAAVQLAGIAEVDQAAVVDAVDHATEFNVAAAQGGEVTGLAAVLGQAGDGEVAVGVAGFGTAGVEETRAVRELHDLVDMRGDADIFAGVMGGVRDGVADAGGGVHCGTDQHEQKEREGRTHMGSVRPSAIQSDPPSGEWLWGDYCAVRAGCCLP
jgi:hypothetical protein